MASLSDLDALRRSPDEPETGGPAAQTASEPDRAGADAAAAPDDGTPIKPPVRWAPPPGSEGAKPRGEGEPESPEDAEEAAPAAAPPTEEERRLAMAARRLEAIRAERSQKRKQQRLLAIVLVLLAAALALILFNLLKSPHHLKVLTAEDFRDLHEVVAVQAAPPSLYVTVSSEAWSKLGHSGRTRLVEEVGARAQKVHYFGAVLRTPDGRVVAQWFANGRVTVASDPTKNPS